MLDSFARRLTDQQLLQTDLRVDDPASLPNLSSERPDPELAPVVVGDYHLPTTSEPLRCCHCKQHTRHWNGFVITNETGQNYLIGSSCGPLHYGVSFTHAKQDFKGEKDRQFQLKQIASILVNAEQLKSSAAAAAASEAVSSVLNKQRELKSASPDMVGRLGQMFENGSMLTEIVQRRDLEQERKRDERLKHNTQESSPIMTWDEVPIGNPQGVGFLSDRFSPSLRAAELIASVDDIVQKFGTGTDEFSTRELRACIKRFSEAFEAMEQTLEAVKEAPKFFGQDNIARMSRWSRRFKHFDLQPVDHGIEIFDHRKGKVVVSKLVLTERQMFSGLTRNPLQDR